MSVWHVNAREPTDRRWRPDLSVVFPPRAYSVGAQPAGDLGSSRCDTYSNATGLPVPSTVVEKLRAGQRPKVTVTLKGYTYRSTIAVYGGEFFLPLAAAHREMRMHRGLDAAGDLLRGCTRRRTSPRPGGGTPGVLHQVLADRFKLTAHERPTLRISRPITACCVARVSCGEDVPSPWAVFHLPRNWRDV